MELKLFINNSFIDSVPVNFERLKDAEYIAILRAELEEKNEDVLVVQKGKPVFFIDNVPSSMNPDFKKYRN